MSDQRKQNVTPGLRFERDRLLAWLGEVLERSEAVDVDIVVVDASSATSSVQITLRDLPGPLAGLRLRPVE